MDEVAAVRKIGLLGATGLIGTAMREHRDLHRYRIVPFSRTEKKGFRLVPEEGELDLSGLDAVVNLAGESLLGRWTEKKKEAIRESRLQVTRRVVAALGSLSDEERPRIFLNASAIGYYGDRGDEVITEEDPRGEGFTAELCADWEAAARPAELLGVRTVFLRTGIVLGEGGGAWPLMRRVFNLCLGGVLGSGEQWMPWIHLEDEVRAIAHCLQEPLSGPVNLTAPQVVTNRHFTKTLGQALGRPTVMKVPATVLRAALGDFAEELLEGAQVTPAKLVESGFSFRYPTLPLALGDLTQ